MALPKIGVVSLSLVCPKKECGAAFTFPHVELNKVKTDKIACVYCGTIYEINRLLATNKLTIIKKG